LLLTFAEVQFSKKLIWIAGWFPTNKDSLSGNFVLRHAQAVASRLSKNPEFDPILTVFHFPLHNSIKDVPNPNADADLNWRYIHSDNIFSISKSTVYRSHVPASNGFYEASAAESVENHNIQGGEIELIWTPIMQFSGVLSKPLNAIWYWLVVFAVLVNHYRKNADKESYLHLHAGDKIAWPLGFVKKHIWSKAFFCLDLETMANKFNWLHVSNFDNRKQVPLIINAFNKISAKYQNIPMNLILVGGDSTDLFSKNLEIDINSVKSDPRIKIVGKVSSIELSGLMNLSSALILFSIAENAPCIVAEAQCCGLPIITSAVAGIPEMRVLDTVWFTNGLNEENLVETMEQYLRETMHEDSFNSTYHQLLTGAEKNASQMLSAEIAIERFHPDIIGQEILSAYLRYTPYS